jgi:DNA-directed RNA polymerase II subunit RPB1
MKKNEKDVFSKISRCAILSNTTADKEQIIHIRFSMSSFNYQILVDFLNIVLENITLKGIDGIEDIALEEQRVLNFNKETGASQVEKEFVVTTIGINLERIKYMKGVNLSRVIVNDIFTIYRNYGIEATRQILMIEYYKVLGDKLNSTHLSLLVDMMTHNGETTSIDRHGLSKLESDPCARASFEQTMDHFINAAIFNEKDTMKSISSNVMLGKVIPGGTGSFDLMIDTNKFDGCILTFDANNPAYSYSMLNDDGLVTKTVEKEVISNKASVGLYCFSKGSDFVKYGDRMIKNNIRTKNEFYVCPLYNLLIEDGLRINTLEIEEMYHMGTPSELEEFNKNYLIKLENEI